MNSQRVYTIKKWFIVVLSSLSFVFSCLLIVYIILGYKMYSRQMEKYYREHLGDSLSTQPKEVNLTVSTQVHCCCTKFK